MKLMGLKYTGQGRLKADNELIKKNRRFRILILKAKRQKRRI